MLKKIFANIAGYTGIVIYRRRIEFMRGTCLAISDLEFNVPQSSDQLSTFRGKTVSNDFSYICIYREYAHFTMRVSCINKPFSQLADRNSSNAYLLLQPLHAVFCNSPRLSVRCGLVAVPSASLLNCRFCPLVRDLIGRYVCVAAF